MEKKNFMILGIAVFSLMLLGLSAFILTSSPMPDGSSANVGDGINYHSDVCVVTTGDFDGRSSDPHVGEFEIVECYDNPNLLTDAGKEAIKGVLTQTASFGNFSFIGLCNATAGCTGTDAGDTALDNEYAGAGLERTAGTYEDLGTGEWSYYNTFTATADALETNQTGLFNQTSGGTLFAENTFTLVTLQTNDQLTINWTIQVT